MLYKKKIGLLFLLTQLLLSSILFGQDRAKKNARRSPYAKSSVDRSSTINEKLKQAKLIMVKNPLEAIELVEEGLALAIEDYYPPGEAEAYFLLGKINFDLEEYRLALINYQKSKDIYSRISDKNGSYSVLKELGKVSEMLSLYEQALKYYQSFLQLAKEKGDQREVLFTQRAIGDIYAKKGALDEAEKVYEEVAVEAEGMRPNKAVIASAKNSLGGIKQKQDKNEEALRYYQEAQKIAEEAGAEPEVNEAFDNIYSIYEDEDNTSKKLEIKEEALKYNARAQNIPEQIDANYEIAEIYLETDDAEEAIEYLENSIALSDEFHDLEGKSKAMETLSKAYDKIGNKENALKAYREYLVLEKKWNEKKKAEMEVKLQRGRLLEKVQGDVEILEKDKDINEKTIDLMLKEQLVKEEQIKKQKTIIYALGGGLFVILISFVLIAKNIAAKRKVNQLLVLKSLRSQMNPHFIFNALNSVNNFISKNEERLANKYLSDFSKLMRQVMENSQEDFIPLASEIAILQLYTKLEHFRFKDKFDYEFNINENVDEEAFMIPPMLIQPYIENAVWHGLRYKESKGQLLISMEQMNDLLKITIEDDGIGRTKSMEIKTKNQKQAKSTGMKNIDSRVKILNDVYKAKINVDIRDANESGDVGTKVIIHVPQNDVNIG